MCTAECYMKGKCQKAKLKFIKSCKMPEKRCSKASTIQYTPDCGRDTEVNEDWAFILQLIILKSYLTCHRLSIHKWIAFAPVTMSIIHCCIPFHQPRFSVFKGVRRVTGDGFLYWKMYTGSPVTVLLSRVASVMVSRVSAHTVSSTDSWIFFHQSWFTESTIIYCLNQ